MKRKTGNFELVVAFEGAYMSRKRQSSDVAVSVETTFVPRHTFPCLSIYLGQFFSLRPVKSM